MLKFFVLSAFSLSGFALALASEIPSVPAKRLSKPPVIDGVISKEEWSEAPSIQGFVDAVTGKPVADDTQIWLAFDKDAIYVAFYAKDSKPEEIVGREIKPGSDFDGEDVVEFQVNPQGNRNFSGRNKFLVNSLNTKSEQISGGRAAKREWIGEWTSGTQRVADGWTVEIRIPWKMLNYPSGANRTMDINFFRFQARTKIESKWADNTTQEKSELDGIWEGVQPPTPASPRPSFLA